jgi:hypothetical protein
MKIGQKLAEKPAKIDIILRDFHPFFGRYVLLILAGCLLCGEKSYDCHAPSVVGL